jgi:calcineurin-like phosphoesterase family protein
MTQRGRIFVFTAALSLWGLPSIYAQGVSFINLIATPERYHGKVVFLSAYVSIQFENNSLCPTKNVLSHNDCLWLTIDTGQDRKRYSVLHEIWRQFDGQAIFLRGTFNKNDKGHLSGWPGSIEKVTGVYGENLYVDFTSNPPLQRRRQSTLR